MFSSEVRERVIHPKFSQFRLRISPLPGAPHPPPPHCQWHLHGALWVSGVPMVDRKVLVAPKQAANRRDQPLSSGRTEGNGTHGEETSLPTSPSPSQPDQQPPMAARGQHFKMSHYSGGSHRLRQSVTAEEKRNYVCWTRDLGTVGGTPGGRVSSWIF